MIKTWLPWIFKLTLTGALFWYLAQKIDFVQAWERGRTADPLLLLLACLLLVVQVGLGAVRWDVVMRAIRARLPLGRVFSIFYAGNFFNLALPGALGGDAVRIWMGRRAGLALGPAVNGVMIERVLTLLSLMMMVAILQPVLIYRVGDIPGRWIFPLASLAAVVAVGMLMTLDRLPAVLARWRLVSGLRKLAGDSRRVFLSRHAFPAFAWAFAGHANLALVFWLLALSLGLDVYFLDFLVLVPPIILLMTLPISVAGWGVREAAVVMALSLVGVDPASALVVSVLYGLVNIAANLPGGLFWLLARENGPHAPGSLAAGPAA
ncbi:lysylphosphatidylglycerol synthase transmembrane domain-containing protein [Telmatospirillum sp. J64-1]|uniref:lysylphosphatidylglycerol synthase transmembrane domain-containing protein n=1 Tax=Telmatospirillum sp. J64-1 TaxID=2502183 RepID=UPI00115F0CBB|nr:lysylphosphatidylglycerol synthase transmembrane domain-containing protein [Telmatospirillum sp. J64-1]